MLLLRSAFAILLFLPTAFSVTEYPSYSPTKSPKSTKASKQEKLVLEDLFLDRDASGFSYGNGRDDTSQNPVTTKISGGGSIWTQWGAVEDETENQTGEYSVMCTIIKGWIKPDQKISGSKTMCDFEICVGDDGPDYADCIYLKGTTHAGFYKGGWLRRMDSFTAAVIGGIGRFEGSIGSAADVEFEIPIGGSDENPPTEITISYIDHPYYSSRYRY